MFKKIVLIISLFLSSFLRAEIIEIDQIDDIRPYIVENGLYLFNIDETLIGSPFSLGSSAWRGWVKSKIPNCPADFVLYDALTLYIAKHAPYQTVEPSTASLVLDLQNEGHAVFAFTARGRSQWYTTDVKGIDHFTREQLSYAGIDFMNTRIPEELQSLEPTYFYD